MLADAGVPAEMLLRRIRSSRTGSWQTRRGVRKRLRRQQLRLCPHRSRRLGACRSTLPLRAAAPVTGAVTFGELDVLAASPENTGGSSSTVYSRTRWPRAQSTSTSSVANGSLTASAECTCSTVRPSAVLRGSSVTPARKAGYSRRLRPKVSREARLALRPERSSALAPTMSMSASSGAVEGGLEVNLPQTQRQRGRRQQQNEQQNPAKVTRQHRVSQRTRLLSNP